MATLFLHVGPPKTATTFLQREVLSRIQSVRYLDKPTVPLDTEPVSFGDLFCFSPDIWTEGEGFARLLDVHPDLEATDCIISDEHIYGGFASPQPWTARSGEAYGPVVRTDRQTDGRPGLSLVARHLQRLSEAAAARGFSEVKVLSTTRRQDRKLASGYAQMSSRVQGASQAHFEQWVRHLIHDPIGRYAAGGEKLDFYSWWQKATEALGNDHVLFLPFERLNEDPADFLREWLAFLELKRADEVVENLLRSGLQKRNVQSKARSVWALKKPKQIGPSISIPRALQKFGLPEEMAVRWPDISRGSEIRLTAELSTDILGAFAESNRLLEKAVPNLDLERYGYY